MLGRPMMGANGAGLPPPWLSGRIEPPAETKDMGEPSHSFCYAISSAFLTPNHLLQVLGRPQSTPLSNNSVLASMLTASLSRTQLSSAHATPQWVSVEAFVASALPGHAVKLRSLRVRRTWVSRSMLFWIVCAFILFLRQRIRTASYLTHFLLLRLLDRGSLHRGANVSPQCRQVR